MTAPTRVVIDVGTNTIKMTVARMDRSRIVPLLECNAKPNARLGAGFYGRQKLRSDIMRAAAKAVRELSAKSGRYNPVSVRAIATSAVRDANNREEFVDLVRRITGLSLEVLSGKTEAEWIFRGVTSDDTNNHEKLLVLGFGGGSTAAIVRESGRVHYRSFDLGAVRLMEMLRIGRSPTKNDRARCEIYLSQVFKELIVPQLKAVVTSKFEDFTLVVTGGVATALAKMKIAATKLTWDDEQVRSFSSKEVSRTAKRLWALNHDERKAIPGLSKARCDVILPGLAILAGGAWKTTR